MIARSYERVNCLPCRASPCPASPGRAMPSLPCRAVPASPSPAGPCPAWPCLATPAMPCHAWPRPATPRQACQKKGRTSSGCRNGFLRIPPAAHAAAVDDAPVTVGASDIIKVSRGFSCVNSLFENRLNHVSSPHQHRTNGQYLEVLSCLSVKLLFLSPTDNFFVRLSVRLSF